MSAWIGLIRGIGGATHAKMPMAGLRDGCAAAGLDKVSTYIASGNLLFRSAEDLSAITAKVRGVIDAHGLDNWITFRTPGDLDRALERNPFAEAAVLRPSWVLIYFLDAAPTPERVAALAGCAGLEQVAAVGRELYIDFVTGVGPSKLTPSVIDRQLGPSWTGRNCNTVGKLAALGAALVPNSA